MERALTRVHGEAIASLHTAFNGHAHLMARSWRSAQAAGRTSPDSNNACG